MRQIADDFTTALRQIRRQPGFALVVVLTLGSAMGISTALFSIGDQSWSREWPVPQADRIVSAGWLHMSVAEARYWADHATTFEGLAAHQIGFSRHRVEGRRVFYDFVTTNYFDVLRVPIVLGRQFADTDDRLAGAEPEAVVSYRTWEERFERDPGIIGKRVPLGTSTFTISGVAAPGFEGGGTPLRRHFWFSLSAREALQIANAPTVQAERPREVRMFGRLAEGVEITRANAELLGLSERFWAERGLKAERFSLQGADTASLSPKNAQETATYYTLLLAIAFLCMIACANVSNLFLARSHARRGEIAVRLSLGASRAQLVRQLLIEALLLSLVAGILGMAFASLLPAHFFSSAPDVWEMVRVGFHLDARVFAWTLLLSSLACAVFGLAPALRVTGLSASEILKDANGQSSPSLRTSLTSMQAFVSVMALGIAGLVLRSDTLVQGKALAQRMEGLVMVRPVFPREYDATRIKIAKAGLFEALSAGSEPTAAVREDPHVPVIGERADLAVSSGYFGIMGLSFLAGRAFGTTDSADRVIVVSEALARTLWPGENPLGKSVFARTATATPREVIGVVRDASPGEPASYTPISTADMNLFLVHDSESRFRGRGAEIARSVDPSLQLDITGGELWLAQTSPGAVLTTRLFGEFGAFALALTAVGLFSLSEYLVRQRTREIGIRTALGARPRHILSAILKPATRSLASGLAAGTVGAILGGFLMRHWGLPTGVHPLDAANYLVVGLLMVGVAVLAMSRPAVRAMRVEPSEALRYE